MRVAYYPSIGDNEEYQIDTLAELVGVLKGIEQGISPRFSTVEIEWDEDDEGGDMIILSERYHEPRD